MEKDINFYFAKISTKTIKYRIHDKSLYNSKFNDNSYQETILKSQIKFLGRNSETDRIILSRLNSISFKFYKEDYYSATYWNYKRFIVGAFFKIEYVKKDVFAFLPVGHYVLKRRLMELLKLKRVKPQPLPLKPLIFTYFYD